MTTAYKLTKTADEAVEAIYIYGFETFGESIAESYHDGLHHTFGTIAKHPFVGKLVAEFRADLRQFRFQTHSIFYSVQQNYILIEHVLHGKADVRRHFIDS